jgi:hypothetical protein
MSLKDCPCFFPYEVVNQLRITINNFRLRD